jgi:hypothetical protein
LTYIMYIYGTDGFMKKYLLLRNNKQTGPYSSEELLEMGLKPQDLLWMEGKSASWRYPAEFDEFKTHPSVVQEVLPDRLFTDVQNLVFHLAQEEHIPVHSFPDDELIEFPTMARFMDPELNTNPEPGREKITSTSIVPIESGIPEELPEMKPIFEEKVSADLEEKPVEHASDLIDLNAPSETSISLPDEIKLADIPAEPEIKPVTGEQVPPETDKQAIVPPRVSVTLPTAVSDHTFVVIHPKDIEKKPIATNNISPEPIPVAASLTPLEIPQKVEIIPQPIEEKIPGPIPEKVVFEAVADAKLEIPQMKMAESAIPEKVIPVQMKTVMVEEKAVVSEKIQPKEKVEETKIVYIPVEQTASGNLMQKLAVAAGIISLVGVAGLIANSIFNPDAYNYQVNSKPAITQPVSTTPVPGTQDGIQSPVTETAVPSNTNLQEPVPANSALPAGGVKKKDNVKQVKANDNLSVPANSGDAENNVNINASAVSNEQKAPAVDPREETRKHINKLVYYELNNYKVNAFGGVSDFEVVINNNSAYPLDLVVVELKYIQSNKKVYKTETLEFRGVAPKGKQSIGVAKTNRGIKVETTITSISSRELDLSYHQ